MNYKKTILIMVCLQIFVSVAHGDNTFNKDWYWTYRGNIAGKPGGLTVVYDQTKVLGELYYDSDYVSIPLSGTIDGRKIILKTKEGLTLDASFQDYDDNYDDSKLNREVIRGEIKSPTISGPVYLRMDYGSAGDLDSMYDIGGMDNDEMVDNFAQEFKRAVLNKDKEAVVNMVCYPLKTDIGEIQDKDELILKFDEIFYPAFLEALKKAIPKNMFSKYSGAMMTSDDNVFWIWFGGDSNNISVVSIFSDREKLLKGRT